MIAKLIVGTPPILCFNMKKREEGSIITMIAKGNSKCPRHLRTIEIYFDANEMTASYIC